MEIQRKTQHFQNAQECSPPTNKPVVIFLRKSNSFFILTFPYVRISKKRTCIQI